MKRRLPLTGIVVACALLVVFNVAGEVLLKAPDGAWAPAARRATLVPVARFAVTSTAGAAPLVVRFTDTSQGSPTAWLWNFGDGATATAQNPTHTYKAVGKYTVRLTASNAGGSNTVTRSDYITVSADPPPSDWTTIVDDEFNAPGVPSHWSLYSGSYAGSTGGCAAHSQVQVPGDGYLHLKMEYRTNGICGRDWYTGGMQIAKAYGGVNQAITVRWRIVPSAHPNIVRSTRIIPMRWVDDPNYAWFQGEADYCEGSYLDGCYAYLHYDRSDQTANNYQIVHHFSIDLTQWHTWRIEQFNHKVFVYIDNLAKPVWVYNGNSKTVPSAFMRTVLQQECSLTAGCPSTAYAGDVEDIQIDWIIIQNLNADPGAGDTAADPSSATVRTPYDEAMTAQISVTSLASYTAPTADSRRRFISG